jgi:hypothetical protein
MDTSPQRRREGRPLRRYDGGADHAQQRGLSPDQLARSSHLTLRLGRKPCLFAVYANGLQFVSIVYAPWNHTDHEALTVWSAEKMQSLSRDELAYRQFRKRRCQNAAGALSHAPYPSQVLFEIVVTLAAALSIALIGNVLAVCLSG